MTERLSRRGRGPRRPLPEPEPGDWPVTLLRPRTVGPYGRPEPVVIPPLEAWNDPGYEPVSGLVPAVSADGGLGDDTGDTPVPGGRSLLRSNLAVASGTAVSRITGLLRTVILFWVLARDLGDAYVLANNTPNIIYELILGGVLTATLVPLFTDAIERKDDDATSAVVTFTVVALGVLTALGFVLTPLLIDLYASNPGTGVDPAVFSSVGTTLALFFVPQIFFYGLMALGSALLNARHRFFAAAWAPVLNNVIVIAALLSVPFVFDQSPGLDQATDTKGLTTWLGLGSTLGIAAMAIALLPALRRSGVRVRFLFRPRHPYVRRAIALSVWTFGYVIANQVAGQVIAVLTEPGSGGARNYAVAFQFFQLPHGLLAVSIMTTFEPDLARAAARFDYRRFNERLLLGLRLIGLLIIPASIGLLTVPLASLVPAAHDSIRYRDLAEVGRIAAGFSIGLVGFSAYLFTLRGFYAQKDTRTPFFINCGENVVNIALAVLLVGRFGVVGLAWSYAIAYCIAAVVALVVLTRRNGGFDMPALVSTYWRLALAGAVMAAAVLGVGLATVAASDARLLLTVALCVLVGMAVYVAAVMLLRVPGADQALDAVRRRLPGRRRRPASA